MTLGEREKDAAAGNGSAGLLVELLFSMI